MKNIIVLFVLLFNALSLFAQFVEMKDPKATDPAMWNTISANNLSFIDTEFSLSKTTAPHAEQIKKTWTLTGWKNETVQTQLAFWGTQDHTSVELSVSDLTSDKAKINREHIKINPITYVMSDLPGDLTQGCGISITLDSVLVADRITNGTSFVYSKNETRPIWLQIHIPTDADAGLYKGKVYAKFKNKKLALDYTVEVKNQTLPDPKNWTYHLDLWQNPYAVARYHKVEPFSDTHFKILQPHIQRLANAGQKNITATLIYDPWNGQTYDKYDAMVKWIKKKDGTWTFDYTVFDKWVTFMQQQGIQKFINCYSMIPWNLSFYYWDEATNKMEIVKAKPGEAAYENHWMPFLIDFAKHLKAKGWFEKTNIAMDERPMKDMLAAIEIIKKADKSFNISLAGTYHEELAPYLSDYCITLNENMPQHILDQRNAKGFTTTAYTCCTEIFPNTYTNSGYSEATWLSWNAMQRGFHGYLRWAFDCWNAEPNLDSRFGTWMGGDTYLVYPDNTSSIRFERLREGIQDFEKIKIVKQQLLQSNNTGDLKKLHDILTTFSNNNINRKMIPEQVKSGKSFLNSLAK